MTFDPTKPVQTRDGLKARIVSDTSPYHDCKYIAVITLDHGCEFAATFTSEGYYYSHGGECGLDLINIPEKREMWVNVYENGAVTQHGTKEDAALYFSDRIACVRVKYEVGEGL